MNIKLFRLFKDEIVQSMEEGILHAVGTIAANAAISRISN